MYAKSALDALPKSSLLPGLILLVALTHLAVGARTFHPRLGFYEVGSEGRSTDSAYLMLNSSTKSLYNI